MSTSKLLVPKYLNTRDTLREVHLIMGHTLEGFDALLTKLLDILQSLHRSNT